MPHLQAMPAKKSRLLTISSRFRFSLFTVVVGILGIGVIGYYDVDKTITAEDATYIQKFIPFGTPQHAAELPYAQQILAIQQVQRNLMQTIELGLGIPDAHPREPKDLYESHKGLCYSRSRVLEKVYMHMGFVTRHVSLYVDVPDQSIAQELLQPGSPSHAILEVKTTNGWLVVDSNTQWLALDQSQRPYSMKQIKAAKGNIAWAKSYSKGCEHYYDGSPFFIYGLYSRHGQFYPPFTRGIPDYNLRELVYNF